MKVLFAMKYIKHSDDQCKIRKFVYFYIRYLVYSWFKWRRDS